MDILLLQELSHGQASWPTAPFEFLEHLVITFDGETAVVVNIRFMNSIAAVEGEER